MENETGEYVKDDGKDFSATCADCGAVVELSADEMLASVEAGKAGRNVAGVFVCADCRELGAAHAAVCQARRAQSVAYAAQRANNTHATRQACYEAEAATSQAEHADSVAIWQKAQREK